MKNHQAHSNQFQLNSISTIKSPYRLEIELAFYDSTVQRYNHYTTRTRHTSYMSNKYFLKRQKERKYYRLTPTMGQTPTIRPLVSHHENYIRNYEQCDTRVSTKSVIDLSIQLGLQNTLIPSLQRGKSPLVRVMKMKVYPTFPKAQGLESHHPIQFRMTHIWGVLITLQSYIQCFPSRLGLQNTLTAPLQRGKTPPTSVLDMTLDNLLVRFH